MFTRPFRRWNRKNCKIACVILGPLEGMRTGVWRSVTMSRPVLRVTGVITNLSVTLESDDSRVGHCQPKLIFSSLILNNWTFVNIKQTSHSSFCSHQQISRHWLTKPSQTQPLIFLLTTSWWWVSPSHRANYTPDASWSHSIKSIFMRWDTSTNTSRH